MSTIVHIDESEITREGLKTMLEKSGYEVIGSFAEITADMVAGLKPDIVMVEVFRIEGRNNMELIGALREKGLRVVVFTLLPKERAEHVGRCKAIGVAGYLVKNTDGPGLLRALEAALKDEPVPGSLLATTTATLENRRKDSDSSIPLTQRETQVLRHVAMGLSNKEIARSLGITIDTVKEHVQHMLRKMGVNDRTQAAVWAVRKGLV